MKAWLFKWRGAVVAVLALGLLLVARPTPVSLALGLSLSVLGELIRLWAIGYTGESTRKQELDAPRLITAGPYSLTRNPLYLGNLLNGVGVTVAASGGWSQPQGALAVLSLAGILWLVYTTIITLEESYLTRLYGELFHAYCARVPRLWPRRGGTPGEGEFAWSRLRFESSTLVWLVLIWGLLLGRGLLGLGETPVPGVE